MSRQPAVRATLKNLEALARKAGVEVRYEPMRVGAAKDGGTGRGGLVRLRGQAFIVCDIGLSPVDRLFVVAEALAELGVEWLPLPPIIRARLGRRRRVLP